MAGNFTLWYVVVKKPGDKILDKVTDEAMSPIDLYMWVPFEVLSDRINLHLHPVIGFVLADTSIHAYMTISLGFQGLFFHRWCLHGTQQYVCLPVKYFLPSCIYPLKVYSNFSIALLTPCWAVWHRLQIFVWRTPAFILITVKRSTWNFHFRLVSAWLKWSFDVHGKKQVGTTAQHLPLPLHFMRLWDHTFFNLKIFSFKSGWLADDIRVHSDV